MSSEFSVQKDTIMEENINDNLHAGAHALMYSNKPLTPGMIASLTHIHTSLSGMHVYELSEESSPAISFLYIGAIIAASLGVAMLIGTTLLYTHEIGPFYTEAAGR